MIEDYGTYGTEEKARRHEEFKGFLAERTILLGGDDFERDELESELWRRGWSHRHVPEVGQHVVRITKQWESGEVANGFGYGSTPEIALAQALKRAIEQDERRVSNG